MDPGEVKPERLGPFHQGAQIRSPRNRSSTSSRRSDDSSRRIRSRRATAWPLRKGRDGIIDDLRDCSCGGAHRLPVSRAHNHQQVLPQPPGR